MSSLEEHIVKILQKENIPFIREKTFQDLKRGLYRFDFYLPTLGICIEVDGAQHFKFTKKFYKNRTDFLKAQERDRQKNSYCLAHSIPLYRIPYFEVETIKSLDEMLQKKFFVTSKWHNDALRKLI